MSKNQMFCLSIGCLFILLSYMMERPIYLIMTGIVFIAGSLLFAKKGRKSGRQVQRGR